MRGIKALFWDNDGVLVDTEQLYFEATRDILAEVGVSLTREQYLDLFLIQGRGAWHLVEDRCSPEEIVHLRDRRNARYGEVVAVTGLAIEGVADVLAGLHGRFVMGVVTSSRRDHFDIIHRDTGLLSYFDFVLTSDDCRRTKPDPELYLKAIARSGVDPDACLAIEDSERGVLAARAAGIRCVAVPSGLNRGRPFIEADRVLPRVSDLLDVLDV